MIAEDHAQVSARSVLPCAALPCVAPMIAVDHTLDTLGLFCPIPVILTSKKIKQIEMEQVLEVLSDDEGIKKDMPAWCKNSGHEFLDLQQAGRVFKVYVRRKK